MKQKKSKRKCAWCGSTKTTRHSIKGHLLWCENPIKKGTFICHPCRMSYNYHLNPRPAIDRAKKDYEENKPEKLAYAKRRNKIIRLKNPKKLNQISLKSRLKNKKELFEHLSKGTPKCTCCGVKGIEFLTVDHIIPKKKMGKYKTLKRLGFKEKMKADQIVGWLLRNLNKKFVLKYFQILCWNCNRGKFLEGICPHKIKDYWQTVLLRL